MTETKTQDVIPAAPTWIRVWDPFVRLFHWSLVVAYFVAYFTEDDAMTVHVWAGYVVGALVLLRVGWGFIGTRHARFSDFAYGPRAALRYLVALLTFRAERHLGHSPAGAFMVYALLVSLLLAVATGLLAYGAERKGPLAPLFAGNAAPIVLAIPSARADENDDDNKRSGQRRRKDEFWEEVHEVFANFTLFLIFLHIGGVVLASLIHRENLPRAMITGRKRP
ncbi:MAG TPA: cytochrome b/b6 domain-containing protein [Alphaproteobacteria bacterium]|nr:cytochrome b/b6 domain-containing protein [Alphaproteobacteria bacterium]